MIVGEECPFLIWQPNLTMYALLLERNNLRKETKGTQAK